MIKLRKLKQLFRHVKDHVFFIYNFGKFRFIASDYKQPFEFTRYEDGCYVNWGWYHLHYKGFEK